MNKKSRPHVFTACAVGLVAGLSLFCASGLLTTGCVSTPVPGSTNTVQTLDPLAAGAIQGVVAAAMPVAVAQDSNTIPYLRLTAQVLTSAANSGTYDPAEIQSAMNAISIKEIRVTTAGQIVTSALAAYKGFYGDAGTKGINAAVKGPWLSQILTAISTGITDGLPPAAPQ